MLQRVRGVAGSHPTPFVAIDLEQIRRRYAEFVDSSLGPEVFFPVKANQRPEVLALLHDLGCGFEVASRFELDRALSLGVHPSRINCGNPIKKKADVRYSFARGVQRFCTDTFDDLANIAAEAPGARVYVRLAADGYDSDWPLAGKFGTCDAQAKELLLHARSSGLVPCGISFHVGSQQRNIDRYRDGIQRAKHLFDELARNGVELSMLNRGGGFPTRLATPSPPVQEYLDAISAMVDAAFPHHRPDVIVEPGRGLVAEAGVIVSEIVRVCRAGGRTGTPAQGCPRVHIDIGLFGGLIEAYDEAIRFPVHFDRAGPVEQVVLAGPTEDPRDILYREHRVTMPRACDAGDKAYVFSTGAYTESQCAVAGGGMPALTVCFLGQEN